MSILSVAAKFLKDIGTVLRLAATFCAIGACVSVLEMCFVKHHAGY